jgi:hypothetical protein
MSNNNKKLLANLIKTDCRDILTNDNRLVYHFFDYSVINDKIWVNEKANEEVKKLTKENAQKNINKRKEQDQERKRKAEIKGDNVSN